MALPINEVPRYTTKLPSSNLDISYRPFLVKEEKIMLMALESESEDELQQAVIDTMQSCVMTPGVDVSKLPIFDFEYLYLQVRAKSVGEIIKLRLKCPDDEQQIVEHDLNLDDVKVDVSNKPDNTIKFDDNYGVVLSYPTIKSLKFKSESNIENNLKLIKENIQSIFKGEDVFDKNNISEQELDEWVENLTQKQFKTIVDWFDNMPRLRHKIQYENPKSGKKFTMVLNGASDFF